MADCWTDGLAGLKAGSMAAQGINEKVDSMASWIMVGKVAGWRDECWADGLSGLMAGSRSIWVPGKVAGWLAG